MAEWEYVEYNSLASKARSSFSMGPFGSNITKENYVPSGVPVVRGVNLARGVFCDDDFVFIDTEKADELQSANVSPGDLIFTHRGTIGQVSMIPRKPRFGRYVIGSSQVKTRLDETIAMPEFYYYWFQSAEGQRSILANASQVGVPGIATPLTSIRGIKVPKPPLVEQQAIAAALGALDDKIAVNEHIAATADELAIALASETRWDKRVTLDQLCVLRKEQVLPQELTDTTVAHYSLPAYDTLKIAELVNPGVIKSSKFLVRIPSVLFSKLNPEIPRIWNVEPQADIPALASTEFLVLSPRAGFSTHEIWAVASQAGFLTRLAAKVTGTSKSHQRVRPAEVLSAEVVDPRAFGQVRQQISSLAMRSSLARQESVTLASLRDTLLPKLMSGQLTVKQAESLAEDVT